MSRREVINQGFLEDLEAAHVCTQRALNALDDEYGPKRDVFYRMLLARVNKTLAKLNRRELQRKERE
jgi:hypothetical protein